MFLHSFSPTPILISIGPINIYWYGFFIVCGIISALFVTLKISEKYEIKKEAIFDLSFWLIVNGIIGARIYDVLLEHSYYLANPIAALKIWQGGLAIHGALIAGAITLWYFARRYETDFILLTSSIMPGLALGQTIGRWGNYFNQELFGLPTDLPWGIPIDTFFRPLAYYNYEYFHPTFLYESFGNLVIFAVLFIMHKRLSREKPINVRKHLYLTLSYLGMYSILRFCLEFIRIDYAPLFLGWRWPQVVSILIILGILAILLPKPKKRAIN